MKYLCLLLLFLSRAAFALDYPPKFETWNQPGISVEYRQFTYVPPAVNAAFSSGKVDSIVAFKRGATPRFALINLPGGDGVLGVTVTEDRRIKSFKGWNTYTRMQKLFAANDYYVVTIDATDNVDKIRAIVKALENDFSGIKIYIAGISKSTRYTISLARAMDGEVAGFIHASALADEVHGFDTRKLVSRNVFIHHKDDACMGTPFSNVRSSSQRFGTRLIVLEGGDDKDRSSCGPFTLHAFYQIETHLYQAMNDWMEGK